MPDRLNIWAELEALERRSAVTLAAALLKRTRPSVKELAAAALVSESAVRAWINTRRSFPKPRKEV